MSFVQKSLIALLLALLMAGCGGRVDGMKETIRYSIYGSPDVTLSAEEMAKLKYASQYIKLTEQPRAMVVLGFDDNKDYHWLSGEKETVVTRYGRLVRTAGLDKGNDNIDSDIRYVRNIEQDPLKCFVQKANYKTCDKSWVSQVEIGDGSHTKRFSIKAEIKRISSTTVTLPNNEKVDAIKVEEELTATNHQTTQRFNNTFWLDSQNQRVLKSEQGLVPGFPVMQMEELKSYPVDLEARQ
ncbi:YjbF family lipoprotein [Idiomarina ramblicola]|uniref:YjbF family lipoprotein n=1 Tax=Idiomarina ramblicola TaxID=263724 RepID=A0A432Z1N3_9GAMM|nr:YjbF family lipoprotein [Idiomarina ramblicola]RUO71802.1 hypothetical protein CWI78_04605 [Idiomarina ramblicola]